MSIRNKINVLVFAFFFFVQATKICTDCFSEFNVVERTR